MVYNTKPGKSINYYFQTIRGADKLSKLKDVNLAGLDDTNVLTYDIATQKWIPGTGGGTGGSDMQSGTVAPEGVKNASNGQLYINTSTGVLYFNPASSGTAGWQVVQSSPTA